MLRCARHAGAAGWRAPALGRCTCPLTAPPGCTARSLRHGAAVVTPLRTFFAPGTPGEGFLRHFTAFSEPAKAFSPLEGFRPPAPPSASDAQPFGSLNRTNQLRRYVNVNTTDASFKEAGTASDHKRKLNARSGSADLPENTLAASAGGPSLPSPAPQMDLSKLVRRHTSSLTRSSVGRAAFSSRRTTAPSSASSEEAESAAPPAAKHSSVGANAGSPSHASPSSSTHTTLARAQAAITAAQRHKQAAQQQQREHDVARADTAMADAGKTTAFPPTQRGRKNEASAHVRQHMQVYKEHCTIGWSPEAFYRVVADVEHYTNFLPWCAASEVHTTRRVRVPRGRRLLAGNLPSTSETAAWPNSSTAAGTGDEGATAVPSTAADAIAAAEAELVDAVETTATLTIGFSFLKERYTSRVTLYPGTKIVAALYDEDADAAIAQAGKGLQKSAHHDSFVVSLIKRAASTAGAAAKHSILKHLLCEWEFCSVPGSPNAVEVMFSVSFEFNNPLHSHMIMSNVVTLMTRSFERRCEALYGPPSASKESLPLLH
ncbi:hypothetical protein ABL78_5983 [Leptomonas seymouri]|uniref:Coenzyme Q-binding protein COQ10 START domain-containing protein n=1 Tax=Leptomonas seymouri TaxID=5684 RepID=A0A0N1IIQ5_LEPSE|nr:hypothetical protein ABL78_5983 [Leptomonas seymouri]|eukprot:KPI84968.1 hypothetical protein ABL78_5983 [Leptomonas seymouri]